MTGVQAYAGDTIDIANPASGFNWTFSSNVVMIDSVGEYVITGTSAENRVVIGENVIATITLKDVRIHSAEGSPFVLASGNGRGSMVTLRLAGNNQLITTDTLAGLTVEGYAQLTIEGNGILFAQGGGQTPKGGAGIGGGNNQSAGAILIKSGAITAQGGYGAAGIGGGAGGSGGSFTMYEGTVSASGGQRGAGIGGGTGKDGGSIVVYGGTLSANGGTYGAGAGGGADGTGGSIIVHGGTLSAGGGQEGAGIGGGANGTGGNITINDGCIIEAAGGEGAAGIGGGAKGEGGYITINGGSSSYVAATGGNEAAGIGGGKNENSGFITIKGGYILAKGGAVHSGAGIGGGAGGSCNSITINNGEIFAVSPDNDGIVTGGIGGADGSGTVIITGGVVYASSKSGTSIGSKIYITGGTIVADTIGVYKAGNSISGQSTLVIAGALIDPDIASGTNVFTGHDVDIHLGDNSSDVTLQSGITVPAGATLTIFEGMIFDANHQNLTVKGSLINNGKLINTELLTYIRDTEAETIFETSYIDISAVSVNGAGFTADNQAIIITHNGKYVITGASTSRRIMVNNNVTADITLKNVDIEDSFGSPFWLLSSDSSGARVTLRLEGNNRLVTKSFFAAGLTVEDSARITIEGDGSLLAQGGGINDGLSGYGHQNAGAGIGSGDNKCAGTIIINSGTITAEGGAGVFAAGIGSGFPSRLFNSGLAKDTVSGGTVIINGGMVTATGGADGGAGIGGSFRGTSQSIIVNGGIVVAVSLGGDGSPAGMGSGGYSTYAGNVHILGGAVYASSGTGPGIGGRIDAADGLINIAGGTVIANEIGAKGNSRIATVISGQETIVLSPSINATTFYNQATVLTGNRVGVSNFISAGDAAVDVILDSELIIPASSTLTIPEGIIFDVNHKKVDNYGFIRNYGLLLNNDNLTTFLHIDCIQFRNPADTSFTYTGKAIEPSIRVLSQVIVPNCDTLKNAEYELSYSNNTDAGIAVVSITGKGSYSGTTTNTFIIHPKALSDDCIGEISSQAYTGDSVKPVKEVRDGTTILEPDKDYSIVYTNNILGGATVTVTGKGNYTGEISRTFAIILNPKVLPDNCVGEIAAQVYTGDSIKPVKEVREGTTILVLNRDYLVTYSNNIHAGKATATITGKGGYQGSIQKQFTILPRDISFIKLEDVTYSGQPLTPIVKDGSNTLVENIDYTSVCVNNINVGTATATIKGKGDYTDSVMRIFNILPKDIACIELENATYSGQPLIPVIRDGSIILVEDVDFTAVCANNVNVGVAAATVTGKGNYKNIVAQEFFITPKNLSEDCIRYIEDQSYTGDSIKPSITVFDGSQTLKRESDYKVTYSNNVELGTATATITGTGNYKGTATRDFLITPTPLFTVEDIPSAFYTGSPIVPEITVRDGTKLLVVGTDYTVQYDANHTDAGEIIVTITGTGYYQGVVTRPFTILPKNLSADCIQAIPDQTYTGSPIAPVETVTDGNKVLEENKDYAVAYTSNVNAGRATAVVTGKGNYAGSITKEFYILPQSMTRVTIANIPDQAYTGYPIEPDIVAQDGNRTLLRNEDYMLTYSDNVNRGTVFVTIIGLANYTDTAYSRFSIVSDASVISPDSAIITISLDDDVRPLVTVNPDEGAHIYKKGSVISLMIDAASEDILQTLALYIDDKQETLRKAGTYRYYSPIVIDGQISTIRVKKATGLSIDNSAPNALYITSANGGLWVSGLTPGAWFGIYTLQGQLVYTGKAASSEEDISLREQGIYILRHNNKNYKFIF
ncbi:MAG: Ig-like domain-containing protein [Bacteroidales bacterium]